MFYWLRKKLGKLTREEKRAGYFNPENRDGEPKEELSPSGKYKLILERFKTGKGTWNYTQGTLYKVGEDEPLGCIQRNYSSFPHQWVENHPKGDFFIGGEDYQGQTVIQLDTGTRRDLLPEETKKGHGFCWAQYRYIEEHQLLLVAGCYWACPYEYRFYDFSDPMNGWPELEVTGDKYNVIYDSEKWPTIDSQGVITAYQMKDVYDYKDDYDVEDISDVEWEGPDPDDPDDDERSTVVATKFYKIEDGQVVFQYEWVSDREKAHRARCEEGERQYKEALKKFKETDPLYLAYLEDLKKPGLDPEGYESHGFTYKGGERRWCRRVLRPKRTRKGKSKGYTVDLEWAT